MHTARKLITFVRYYLFAVLSCLYLFSIGFLRGRNRTLLYRIAAHFGPFDPDPNKPKPMIPGIPASEIVPAALGIQILEPSTAEGNVTPYELIIIDQLVKHYRPYTFFEIGTFDGRTTLNLAANGPEKTKVYTLDLPKENLRNTQLPLDKSDALYIAKESSGERFRGTKHERKIVQLYGDSSTFDYGPYIGEMDFVFVDGSHSYEYVLNDSRRALELLRNKRGIILWHDYDSWPGVTRCLNMLYTFEKEFKGLRHIAGSSLVCLINRSR